MRKLLLAALATFAAIDIATPVFAQPAARLADRDIVEAYEYMLGRLLVLRQENLDFKEGFRWNEIIHRAPGGVDWANPNLDVIYSEAWIGLDEKSCTLIEFPEIKGRYYTVQALNGWGEVTANINERNFPKHPSGKFAFCLKKTVAVLPKGTQRVNLPNPKSRILMRIELGAHPENAIALQKKVTMKATGKPVIDEAVVKPNFTNSRLPGVEAFDKTEEILASEADINPGMIDVREKASTVAKAAADRTQRARIDEVIRRQAIPAFHAEILKMGKAENGWMHPRVIGNYRTDYVMRTITNYAGIWANNSKEVVYFTGQGLDGSQSYTQTFPKDALPRTKTRYFWSAIVVDGTDYKVIPNSLNRFLLNKQSPLQFDDDGSLTLAFAPKQPEGIPEFELAADTAGEKIQHNLSLLRPDQGPHGRKVFSAAAGAHQPDADRAVDPQPEEITALIQAVSGHRPRLPSNTVILLDQWLRQINLAPRRFRREQMRFGRIELTICRTRTKIRLGLTPQSMTSTSPNNGRKMMKRILLAALITAFAAGSAFAQSCETKAVGKDGKPLAGAAKSSFVKKCKHDACEGKAVSKDGKPLAGAAKNSFMSKCEKEA